MFKKVLAVFLIVCLQSLSFAGILATVSFQVNMDYISAKICINKAKPKLNCKGKCFLKKKQKEAKEQKEANDTTLKDVYYVMSHRQSLQRLVTTSFKNSYILQNHNKHFKGWPQSPFHPPGIFS